MKITAAKTLTILLLVLAASTTLFAQTSTKITLTNGTATIDVAPKRGTTLFNIDLQKDKDICFNLTAISSVVGLLDVTFNGKAVPVNPANSVCMGKVSSTGNYEIKVINNGKGTIKRLQMAIQVP